MDDHRGSITVAALVGTGAATLGLALFGMAGVGSDLRAADAVNRSTPAITTQELSDSLREERRSPKWDGRTDCSPEATDADVSASPVPTPKATPAAAGSAKEI